MASESSSDCGSGPSLEQVEDTTYLLVQRFDYDYVAPIHDLRHRLMVVPRAVHGGQHLLGHGLTVTGAPALVASGSDEFGNHLIDVRATMVTDTISFEAWARVRRSGCDGVTTLPPASIGDGRLAAPSRLTQPDERLAAAAADLGARVLGAVSSSSGLPRAAPLVAGLPSAGMDLAERACAWVHGALTYTYDVTGVRTSAAEALAAGQGVCQDFAHVMITLCRAAGLPARYVSGHLVGDGGSHAWVEAVVSDPSRPGCSVAVAFDPTHNRRATDHYLTVAVGRDYLDVAPTSGTFEGAGPGALTATKRLAVASTPEYKDLS